MTSVNEFVDYLEDLGVKKAVVVQEGQIEVPPGLKVVETHYHMGKRIRVCELA